MSSKTSSGAVAAGSGPGAAPARAASSPAEPGDPAGAFSSDGVDLTAIRWMLALSPTERLAAAQSLCDLLAAARRSDAQ